ncbi:type VII secretion protein EccB [Streptomyces sp. NPDC005892]|uniref:type VII secretion protein EccB n=1 Tax=Streptomyces sp. NPDC005892 TaxID=3155593 RepID=UPI0033E70B9B
MQSKRDQVQAHLFLMNRLSSGLLLADPDNPESPGGRTHRGLFFGLLGALVGCLVAALWGAVSPGTKTSWQEEGTIVMEKDTGSRYLYVDGRLRPVQNYASARLLLGADPKTASVTSKSTQGTPHGRPVGIPGAPDDLPGADQLTGDPWQICSDLRVQVSGQTSVRTRLAVGAAMAGKPLRDSEAVLVEAPDHTRHLVWHGTRLRLDQDSGAAESLGYGSVRARPVSEAFLDALPAGPDLAPPTVTGRGEPGPELAGRPTRVGQLFTLRPPGSALEYHLLLREGLVRLGATGTALVLGDPRTRTDAYGGKAPEPRPLTGDEARGHLATAAAPSGLPDTPPRALDVPDGSDACVQMKPGDGESRAPSVAVVAGDLPPEDVALPPTDHVAEACLPADVIAVRPGEGALIRALSSAGTQMGDTTYLVTDTGVKYPLASEEVLEDLGYTVAEERGLPSAVLAMLPTGPVLDPEAAAGAAAATVPDLCVNGGSTGTS